MDSWECVLTVRIIALLVIFIPLNSLYKWRIAGRCDDGRRGGE